MELPRTFHNRLSYAGTAISALALVVFGFLLLLHALTGRGQTPYAGIVLFIVVPAFLVLGVVLVPVGMLLQWRRVRPGGQLEPSRFPVVDLNRPRHRNVVLVTSAASLILVLLSTVGGYKAYETTESVEFCGQLCHGPMEPEYTTYQHSPHARVPCVDCHVGPGAGWYLRSKLAGLVQAYAVTFDTYPRPIPAPIESLRPARETCEECHWARQFFGEQHRSMVHFLPDESNTRWRMDMRIKTGGGLAEIGRAEGIHWHMNLAHRLEYFARDAERQEIPWVRVTDRTTGAVTVYRSVSDPPPPEELAQADIRTMDCMDCHNRPAHRFRSPGFSLNRALAARRIDPGLPYVKKKGVELLAAGYASKEEAFASIQEGLWSFYRAEYPLLATGRRAAIEQAVEELRAIYRRNQFPSMRVRWDTYADNIGHLDTPGCARCHDADHRSSDGRTLERSCDTCHLIVAQGPREELETSVDGLAFRHPVDIGGAWKVMACSDCHSGALP